MTSLQLLIPFWGDPALLDATVRSILAQDDPDWTAVVVNDASPHGEEARALVEGRDPRLRFVSNPSNLGITANFQRCLDLADGDLVAFPGCDDLLLPGYVRAVRAAARRHPSAALLLPGVHCIDGEGRPVRPVTDRAKAALRARWPADRPLSGDRLAASLLTGNWLYFPAITFRREIAAAHGFDTRWRVVEDLDLVLRILLDGGQLVLLDDEAFAYRRHAGSVSSLEAVAGSRFSEEARFFAEAATLARSAGWPRTRSAALRRWTSRLHAVTLLPSTLLRLRAAGGREALRRLLRHAVGQSST